MSLSLDKLSQIVNHKRKEINLTQEALADQTGINKDMISRLERGTYLPSLMQLNDLIRVLDFRMADLEEERDEKKVFVALMGSAQTDAERDGFEKMISMMLCLRKHDRLRKRKDEGVLC